MFLETEAVGQHFYHYTNTYFDLIPLHKVKLAVFNTVQMFKICLANCFPVVTSYLMDKCKGSNNVKAILLLHSQQGSK